MRYQVTHQTHYRYTKMVEQCQNEARLLPRTTPWQTCQNGILDISPTPTSRHDRTDYFGNTVSYFAIQQPHDALTVTAISTVDTRETINLPLSPPWEQAGNDLDQDYSNDGLLARDCRLDSPFVKSTPEINVFTRQIFTPGRPFLDCFKDLTHRIYSEFIYDPEFSTVITLPTTVLKHRRGVCQDFAHLAIACARSMGLAARYVSGYLETQPPPGCEKLRGADASHAWLSVYLPGEGWFDFDPTNNQMRTGQYVTTAWGRDYGDVTPLKGVISGGGDTVMEVSVDVEPLNVTNTF